MQAQAIIEALKRAQQSGISITTETLDDYGLGGVECEKCGNTGTIIIKYPNEMLYAKECECMNKRRYLKRLRESGLADIFPRYTFERYETPDPARKKAKQKALAYCDADPAWFYISGKSGSGKSHLCAAICGRLIEKQEVYYMSWRDESVKLKAEVMDTERYEKHIKKLKTVSCLYIDDFLKGSDSDADIRLAFEILNARYSNTKLRTIISSEWDIKKVLERDEALGGRIYERSRGYLLQAPDDNWRLR